MNKNQQNQESSCDCLREIYEMYGIPPVSEANEVLDSLNRDFADWQIIENINKLIREVL